MNLTDPTFRRLRVPEKGRVTYSDDAVPGFGVRVSATGAKSFVLLVGRARRRITIGKHPTITLQQARARAREILAQRVLGKDELPSVKFEDALPIFLMSHYGDHYIKPRTRDEADRVLNVYFLPKFRYRQLADIKSHEVADIIDGMRKKPSMAHHAFGVIRLFFRWAEGRRYVSHSPCAVLRPPRRGRPRERVLSQDEVQAVLAAAQANPSTFATIVELLLVTGQRRGEIANLRAEWIDWNAKAITFPGAVTKNKRQHVLPFGPHVELLLRRGHPKGYLFRGRGTETPFDGWSKCKPAFDRACPIAHWTLHDLRRTFATNLAALGVPVHVTEKLLNHISGTMGGIVAVYQRHAYAAEKRSAMLLWEGAIKQMIDAAKGNESSDVNMLPETRNEERRIA